jgi:hypothetical protein
MCTRIAKKTWSRARTNVNQVYELFLESLLCSLVFHRDTYKLENLSIGGVPLLHFNLQNSLLEASPKGLKEAQVLSLQGRKLKSSCTSTNFEASPSPAF